MSIKPKPPEPEEKRGITTMKDAEKELDELSSKVEDLVANGKMDTLKNLLQELDIA